MDQDRHLRQDCRPGRRLGAGDAGQAFPVYIAAVAGLLFLGFAYFLVGQAAFTRNGAQTAADAAALAAAQDARDQLRQGWLEVIRDPDQWDRFILATEYESGPACDIAAEYARLNQAELSGDRCLDLEPNGFRVTVTTTGPESVHATASAQAVIEPRCEVPDYEPPTEPPSPPPTPPADPEDDADPIVELECGGEALDVDLDDPTLPDAVDLFTVRLADQ
ncbi:pilus assembly protein TadG-related protein [Streptomyces sp. NPDC056144]|uniref:pilus assembly protein TadG-related protein n=1 Tax=unclassified Streptomyces TaxID=2593676 RepID=UPI0035DD579E